MTLFLRCIALKKKLKAFLKRLIDFSLLMIILASAVEGKSLCNHRRAYKFFTDSVSPKCQFPAFACNEGYEGLLKGECFPCTKNSMNRSCGNMGYYSNESSARGKLYLMTREEEPFCAHQYQIKVYNSRNERSVKSYGKLQVSAKSLSANNDSEINSILCLANF